MTTVPLDHPATYEDLKNLPDDVRAEILDGEITVVPSATPRHNLLAALLWSDLHVAASTAGYGAVQDVDVLWQPSGRVTRPDVLVVTSAVANGTELPVHEVPVVVVEVVSPDDPGRDFVKKARIAADAGVPEYWVVDPGTLEVYRHVLVEGRYDVQVVGTDEEQPVEGLPFPYVLRPAVLLTPQRP